MDLFSDLKSELDQESNEDSVRVSALLKGQAATNLTGLHAALGGESVISRNALAVRILTKALTAGEVQKQRRTRRGEELLSLNSSIGSDGEGR